MGMAVPENDKPSMLSDVTYRLYQLGLLSPNKSKEVKKNIQDIEEWNKKWDFTTKPDPIMTNLEWVGTFPPDNTTSTTSHIWGKGI